MRGGICPKCGWPNAFWSQQHNSLDGSFRR